MRGWMPARVRVEMVIWIEVIAGKVCRECFSDQVARVHGLFQNTSSLHARKEGIAMW